MDEQVELLFRELADLPQPERECYFQSRKIPADVRAEVESLLRFDSPASPSLTRRVLGAANDLLESGAALPQDRRCGSYRLVRLLGRGGMGVVFLAQRTDGEVEQRAAVKLLKVGSDSAAARQRFLQERQILANLSHSNIARLLDAGHREDGQPYLVMEYIDGQPIDAYCSSLPVRQQVELLLPICEAVSYAHQQSVIHRDLKPGNILVGPDGVPKLLDFGIAKLMDTASDATTTVERRLTPVYASPEQVRGQPVGMATDIYSLGAILYKLLTSSEPFQFADGMTAAELEATICNREVSRPSQLNRKVDRDLDAIVLKAMRKEQGERYATAGGLADDLKAWLDLRPVRARQGNWAYFAKRHMRKRWAPLAAMVVALSGILAGIIVARHFRDRAERRFETTTSTLLTSTGQSVKAEISPDGHYIAHSELASGLESLRVRQAATLRDSEIVPPASVHYNGITFSPDSSTVYYVARAAGAEKAILYRIPAIGGSSEKVKEGLDSPVALSPDGTKIAFVREAAGENVLLVADLSSGIEQRLASSKLPEVLDYPAWSPDGRVIVCTLVDSSLENARGSDARVIEVNVRNRTQRVLTGQTWGFIKELAWLGDGRGLLMSARDQDTGTFHIWHISYPGGAGRKITDGLISEVGASVSGDSRQIVAVEERTFSSIWRQNSTRAEDPELVVSGSAPLPPIWTPDGRIVFEQQLEGHRNIWITNADGTNQKQLTMAGNNYYPSISRDGRLLTYMGDRSGSHSVWTMDIDGGNQAMVVQADGVSRPQLGISGDPQLSPDGKWMVIAGGSGPWTTLRRVATRGGQTIELNDKLWMLPTISPDGKWIAGFYAESQLNTQKEPSSIAVISADGGRPTKVIPIPPSVSRLVGVRWSPDSRELSYVDRRKEGDNIWSLPLSGGAPHEVTHFHAGSLFGFDWSGDGKQLVFCRGIQARDVMLIQDAKPAR